ncbi:MAG TPA: hypothetical protein VG247_32965 [Pseudonocardiaceae bacterium]|nr:hypothetical protein [Pseudonocardiaceae bacterium]
MNNMQPAKAFRPADARDYDEAQTKLAEMGTTIGDFLSAALRRFNRSPQSTLDILAPDWPPPRVTGRRALLTAFAVQDAVGDWLNPDSLRLVDSFQDCPMAYPFRPSDPYNPLHGQRLTVRCGGVTDENLVSQYAVHVLAGEREIAVRITHDVQTVLFGPAILGTPEWQRWEIRRDERRGCIEAGATYHDLITAREVIRDPDGSRRVQLGRAHAFVPNGHRILCGWEDGEFDPAPSGLWADSLPDNHCPECRVLANNLRAGRA